MHTTPEALNSLYARIEVDARGEHDRYRETLNELTNLETIFYS